MTRQLDTATLGRRNIAALYAYTATSRLWMDGGIWLLYWQHQGLNLFQIGLLEAILHIACVLSDVPVGIFADRFGWKLALACSSLFGVLYTGIALVGHTFWLAAIAFAMRGLQVTFASGSDASIAYESAVWAGLNNHYLNISGKLFAIALISMGVAEAIGGGLAAWSWPAVYLAYMVVNALSLLAVAWIREPRAVRTPGTVRPSGIRIAADAFHFARKSRFFLVWIALSATLSGSIATFTFYGQSVLQQVGWTLMGIGVLTGLENGIGALVSLLVARTVRNFGERQTLTSAGMIGAAGLILFAWLPGVMAGAGFLLNAIALNLADPVIDQGLNRIVPSEQRATLLSFNSTAFSLVMIFVFPLFGFVAAHIGLRTTAHIGSIVAGTALLLTIVWWRRYEQHMTLQ